MIFPQTLRTPARIRIGAACLRPRFDAARLSMRLGRLAPLPGSEGAARSWRAGAGRGALLGGAALLLTLALLLPGLARELAGPRCYARAGAVPAMGTAIVFGAGVTARGQLTPVLRARVDAAVALYRAHRVARLLMSGDDAHAYHDEPDAMRRYALRRGVPRAAIACDYAGFRTYDTCYRARYRFGLRRAVLVTQAFHLPRALLLARGLGIDAVGYAAPAPALGRRALLRQSAREECCLVLALSDLALGRRPHFAR